MQFVSRPLKIVGVLLTATIVVVPDSVWAACGVIEVAKGDIKVENGKTKAVAAAPQGTKLCQGDTVIAGPQSRAKLKMDDGNELNISPDSRIMLEEYEFKPADNKKKVMLNVLYGKVRAATKEENMYNDKAADGQANTFQVKTKSAVAGVRGTDFLTSFDRRSSKSEVVTFRGKVDVGQPGPGGTMRNPVSVGAGQKTEALPGSPPAPPKAVPKGEMASLNAETKADTTTGSGDKKDSAGKKEDDKKDDDKKDGDKKESSDKKDGDKKESDKKDSDKKDSDKKDADKKDDGGKKEEPKKEDGKKDEPKKEEPKREADKKDEPKREEPKREEPKKEQPKKDGGGSNANNTGGAGSGEGGANGGSGGGTAAGPGGPGGSSSGGEANRSPASSPGGPPPAGGNMNAAGPGLPPPPPPAPPTIAVPTLPYIPPVPPRCDVCNQAIEGGPAKVNVRIIMGN